MNRFFTLLLAASCLTAVGQVPDYVPTDGLVAWYPLDGDANDVGPNQFVGQLSGTTAYEGHLGNDSGSFWFDGDAFVHSPFSTLSTEQGVTYTAWVQRASRPGIGYIVSYGNASGTGQSFCLAEGGDNVGLDYGLFATAIGSEFDAKSGQFLPLNEWTFVATTILNNEVSIYINNQVVYEDTIQQPAFQLDGDLRIGVNPSGQGEYWVGAIDDVGVWNRALSVEEIQEVYFGTPPLEGCTDGSACNYDADASVDDGSCHFNCQFCHDGTVWDEDLFKCVVANPADINFDGCVQLNDLLDLLSAYGDCGAEESAWQCGDPLEYQGYDYETVQIGEQCWFAENLRAESYRNGESIVYSGSASDWETNGYTAQGCRAAYNDDPMLGAFWGYIYNGFAVNDERALCPTGWIVPKNADWLELGEFLGGMNVAGQKMKNSPNDEFAWNGDNSSGFGGYATGDRHWPDGSFNHALDGSVGDSEVVIGLYWSGAPGSIPAQNYYALYEMDDELTQSSSNGPPLGFGAAVRCIKDAE